MLGECKAQPNDSRPGKNDGDVVERNGNQGRHDFRLLDTQSLRGNFAEQQNQNRQDNRERHLPNRR